ncbi:uncharacterized protein LOC116248701 [Nymphaea colorata]|nr:uncharacterized protein LOC116248701 [Nymphaea colorata]XP_031477496.1 uncharacterized protein LOC116248701 [Nymphaea colorata]
MEEAKAPLANEEQLDNERKARVNAIWEQMNGNKSVKVNPSSLQKISSVSNSVKRKTSHNWMVTLGLGPKKEATKKEAHVPKTSLENGSSDEAKRLAAAALAAAKEVAVSAAGRGKVEITEVRNFAGEEIEVKKLVDANSKEASEKSNASAAPQSGLDAILEQIKKKPKLSVLDKTKKDWGEFKDENRGMEEELDAYKKSSNQYLDKVSFLERTDMREFEREREIRLALQAKRRSDAKEDL